MNCLRNYCLPVGVQLIRYAVLLKNFSQLNTSGFQINNSILLLFSLKLESIDNYFANCAFKLRVRRRVHSDRTIMAELAIKRGCGARAANGQSIPAFKA